MSIHNQNVKEYLSGNIERITYHNPENGFCVLRVKVKNHKDLVTVTGSVPSVSAGEYIKCSGIWYNDRNHGKLKRLIKPTSGFKSMRTAYATVKGFEVMRMFKKGRFNFWKYGQGIFGEIRIITDNLLAC